MNGLVSKIIVESELFELELAYHEEQKSWGILPHQLLAMKSSGIDPLAYRDLPALAQIYQGLEIDPEVEQACLSVVEDAKEAGYTPISITNDCYARLWGGKYRLGMPRLRSRESLMQYQAEYTLVGHLRTRPSLLNSACADSDAMSIAILPYLHASEYEQSVQEVIDQGGLVLAANLYPGG